MVAIQHPNKTHETAMNLAEMQRQAAVSVAGTVAAVKAAEQIYFRAVIASCVANGVEASGFRQGLYNLTGSYT